MTTRSRAGSSVPLLTAVIVLMISMVTAGCSSTRASKERAQLDAALRSVLQAPARPAYVTADAEGARHWKLTREFYAGREFAPPGSRTRSRGPRWPI